MPLSSPEVNLSGSLFDDDEIIRNAKGDSRFVKFPREEAAQEKQDAEDFESLVSSTPAENPEPALADYEYLGPPRKFPMKVDPDAPFDRKTRDYLEQQADYDKKHGNTSGIAASLLEKDNQRILKKHREQGRIDQTAQNN